MPRSSCRLTAIGLVLFVTRGAAGVEVRSAMELDPYFAPQSVINTIPDRLVPLWLAQLRSADVEAEVLCQVARGLIRVHRLGIPVPAEATAELVKCLGRPGLDPSARLAMARALVELDAQEEVTRLASQSDGASRDMAEIVEPALARWRVDLMRDEWLARLSDPQVSRRSLQLAIGGLSQIGATVAQAPLEAIALDPRQTMDLRIPAARALSTLTTSGLEAAAQRLLASEGSSPPLDRLVACQLLAQRASPQAQELLLKLAVDTEPAVAALAVERLIDLDAALLIPHQRELLENSDPKIRLLGIRAVRARPEANAVSLLAAVLNDHHPDVRRAAGDLLVEFAQRDPERDEVGQTMSALLDPAIPRQAREALLVLGAIDYEPAAERVFNLLDAAEPSVSIAAAWALERLAMPSLADGIFFRVTRDTEHTVAIVKELAPIYAQQPGPDVDLPNLNPLYERVEHLILAMGQVRYRPALDALLAFVPKPAWQTRGDPPALEAFKQPRLRAAAIWAIGMIHAEGGADVPAELVDRLIERMTDTTPIPREEPIVRQMAAVSLGRMRATRALPPIREFFDPAARHDEVGRACGWAIGELTGEPPELVHTRTVRHVDWFLVPLDP